MQAEKILLYTVEEYLNLEEERRVRHEYLNGGPLQ